jgi:hypothetical protein
MDEFPSASVWNLRRSARKISCITYQVQRTIGVFIYQHFCRMRLFTHDNARGSRMSARHFHFLRFFRENQTQTYDGQSIEAVDQSAGLHDHLDLILWIFGCE